ncbi:hypothetical protein ACKKBF_B00220 [Auxenochlorella protothecoides x Auxenochlorella symbiontica]|uniref:Uncharacterized protein n=1 Tax=Auxenochlorella protothecoides TaxID=3075 RepID=A0A1D1ZUR0_AUXPR
MQTARAPSARHGTRAPWAGRAGGPALHAPPRAARPLVESLSPAGRSSAVGSRRRRHEVGLLAAAGKAGDRATGGAFPAGDSAAESRSVAGTSAVGARGEALPAPGPPGSGPDRAAQAVFGTGEGAGQPPVATKTGTKDVLGAGDAPRESEAALTLGAAPAGRESELAESRRQYTRLSGAVQALTAELAQAQASAAETERRLSAAATHAASDARELRRLGAELAAEKERGGARGRAEPDPGSPGAGRVAELAAELKGLRAVQASRDAMVAEWAAEAARSCALAQQAAAEHALILERLETREAELAEARRRLTEAAEAQGAAASGGVGPGSGVAEPTGDNNASGVEGGDAELRLAAALAALEETEEEVDAQAALIARLQAEAVEAAERLASVQSSAAADVEAGNELLAAAEAALQSMGTRLRALEEGRAEGDAGAEAGLRAELAFFQAELEAEMKFCEQAAQRAAAAEAEVERLRKETPAEVPRDLSELEGLIERQAKALADARAEAARAAAEVERLTSQLERASPDGMAAEAAKPAPSKSHGSWSLGGQNGATTKAAVSLEAALQRIAQLESENEDLRSDALERDAILAQSREFIASTLAGFKLGSSAQAGP